MGRDTSQDIPLRGGGKITEKTGKGLLDEVYDEIAQDIFTKEGGDWPPTANPKVKIADGKPNFYSNRKAFYALQRLDRKCRALAEEALGWRENY